MTTQPRPAEYSDGYGELVRAYRAYLGLSQRTLAYRLDMREASLSDIEVGRRRCPKGFIDSVEKIVDEFDKAVEARITALPPGSWSVSVEVTDEPSKEWDRVVTGRAAVESGRILPILVPQQHP